MRISDWSSDVCSSDLAVAERALARFDDRGIALARRRAVEIAHQHRRLARLALAVDPAADLTRAFLPRDLADMVEMGVHDQQVALRRPVAQPRPGGDPRQRGVPALARHIGRRRQPEGARSDEGEAVAAEAERRKFALVLPVVARDADELIGGQIGLDRLLL